MSRFSKHQTTWYLINIKARYNQTTAHYVQVFEQLYNQDPLINFPRGGKSGSLKYLNKSEQLDSNADPCWIELGLLSYTIIDPEAFYNRRSQEDVSINNWNEDIVANKKETDLYFIPSFHIIAVKRSSNISLKNIVFYLSEALNKVESDAFDVDVIVERDILDKVINAYAVTHIYANISFSNPGHTHGFEAAFDQKLREMGAGRIEFTATGSKDHPLNKEDDGMLKAIVNISEHNGYVKATIQETENGNMKPIDSSEHPRKLVIPQIIDSISSTIYNAIGRIFD